MTGRERVRRAITFQAPDRIPLSHGIPAATWDKYGDRLRSLVDTCEGDFGDNGWRPGADSPQPIRLSDTDWVDEWGVTWRNLQFGLMGIPVQPPLSDWSNLQSYHVPRTLHGDFSEVSKVLSPEFHIRWAGAYGGRLFERMQWLRGTDALLMDLADPPRELFELRDRIVESYLEAIQHWLTYDIDSIGFEDDWGSQLSLLIQPQCWRDIFKPAYEVLFKPILAAGKVVSFHTDGNVWDILPDLVDLGVTCCNVQYGLLGIERLSREFKGRLCFHCDLEGQFLMPNAEPSQVRKHILHLVDCLENGGGLILDTWLTPDVPWTNIEEVFSVLQELNTTTLN